MRIIGMDLAVTGAHKAVVMSEQGEYVSPVLSLRTQPEELARLLKPAREGARPDEPVSVVMESTGHAWLPVAAYLLERDVRVYVVNTQQVVDLRPPIVCNDCSIKEMGKNRLTARTNIISTKKNSASRSNASKVAVTNAILSNKLLNIFVKRLDKLSNEVLLFVKQGEAAFLLSQHSRSSVGFVSKGFSYLPVKLQELRASVSIAKNLPYIS